MKALRNILRAIYFSLPVQLVIIQIRYHKFELLIWLFLFLVITNNFGAAFGVPFLFLEPEYMGETGFYSMFLLGLGMGTFFTSYIISSYISDGYRLGFLALEHRPFLLFSLNNLLIPFAFLITYTWCYLKFQIYLKGQLEPQSFINLGGIALGILMVVLMIFVYFFNTNKNYVVQLGKKMVRELKGNRVLIDRARVSMGTRIRVDNFYTGFFRVRKVDSSRQPNVRELIRTMNQNHGNALFFEVLLLAVILFLGFADTNPYFVVPAGVSTFLFISVILMVISAITFWFRRIGPILLLFMVIGVLLFGQIEWNIYRHPAIGLNYERAPALYNATTLAQTASEAAIKSDIQTTLDILNRWKTDAQIFEPGRRLPKMILLCTSGGGLRSAYFTVRTLQKLDSLTEGGFTAHTRFITGASGGMVGAGYWRELHFQQKLGELDSLYRPALARNMGKDLLNRVGQRLVTGLIRPSLPFKKGRFSYLDDRGAAFDRQLVQNLGVFQDRRLGDYAEYERLGELPLFVMCPIIVKDGRKLYISATPVSYLTRHLNVRGKPEPAITGVDFSRFFARHEADSLLFVTAMRMNASFPIITPYVRLPTDPVVQVIDAGVADNYGLETIYRFTEIFGEWLRKNSSGVLLLQIRDSRAVTMEASYTPQNRLKQVLSPIGGTYHAMGMSNDLVNEQYLHGIQREMQGNMVMEKVYYEPDSSGFRASLSWHLAEKEIADIERSLNNPTNQSAMLRIHEWLNEGQ